MKEILSNIFAVEVPKGEKDFGCVHIYHGEDILYYPDANGETQPIANAPCHCDKVQILFTTKNCNEDQVSDIVEGYDSPTGGDDWQDYYRDYAKPQSDEHFPWIAGDPIASLKSLLRSHGLDPNKNYLLLKKIP